MNNETKKPVKNSLYKTETALRKAIIKADAYDCNFLLCDFNFDNIRHINVIKESEYTKNFGDKFFVVKPDSDLHILHDELRKLKGINNIINYENTIMETKENKKRNAFIATTAKDYVLDYETVADIYRMWYDEGLFYEKLEELIEENRHRL